MKSSRKKVSRVALVVLGMHRSGTSSLAGALTLLGCDGPATPMKATEDNSKGYFEPAPLYPLHTRLLESAASSWDDWLPVGTSWLNSVRAEEFQLRAATLIQEQFGKSRLFVLKDPRICRLVPFWSRVLDEIGVTPRYILTHRNPLEVAQSLNRRDGIELEVALLIWLRHVLEAEAATRGQRRCFTSYSELMTSWRTVGHKIEDKLRVALPRLSPQVSGELEDFLSDDLRHQKVATEKAVNDARTAGWVQNVFSILERWVADGESESDFDALDETRRQFDQSAGAYARPLRLLQERRAEWRKLGSEKSGWTAEKQRLETDVESLKAEQAKILADADERLRRQAAGHEAALKAAQEAGKAELAEKTAALIEGRERQHVAIQQARAERDRISEAHKELAATLDALRASQDDLEKKLKEQAAALDAERRKAVEDGTAQAARLTELELELAVARGALEERRMTTAQAEVALVELRDRLIEREEKHARDLAAMEQRLQGGIVALAEAQTAQQQQEEALEELRRSLKDRDDELAQVRSALEQRRHELDQDSQTIAALQEQLATLQAAEVSAGEREVALTQQVGELTRLIVERDTEGGRLRDEQAALQARYDALAAERDSLELGQKSLRDENAALKTQVAGMSETLQAAEVNAGEREAALTLQVSEHDASLRQAERSLGERNRELAELTRLIVERDTEGGRLRDEQAALQARYDALAAERDSLELGQKSLRDENAALKTQVAGMSETLQAAEVNAGEREAALTLQVSEHDASLRQAERSLSERHHELARLAQLIVTREAEHDAKKTYIDELLASRSWRVTKPLRSVTVAMRRVLGRG